MVHLIRCCRLIVNERPSTVLVVTRPAVELWPPMLPDVRFPHIKYLLNNYTAPAAADTQTLITTLLSAPATDSLRPVLLRYPHKKTTQSLKTEQ